MRTLAILFIAISLPLIVDALDFGIGDFLNGLWDKIVKPLISTPSAVLKELNNLIPNLQFGTPVNLLINLATALDILTRPFDSKHALTDCESPIRSNDADSLNRNGLILSGNGLSSPAGKWYPGTNGTWFVPIVMDPRFTASETSTIYAGMIDIQQKTCMRFYIYQESNIAGSDYVKIMRGSGQGCYSDTIGRAFKGRQIVNLQPMEPSGCIAAGIAAHELLHAIGFDHQQCTPGRAQYVTIIWSNIKTAAQHNFDEDDAMKFTNFGSPYDYGSIMHYGETAFTNNGKKTIIVKQAGAQIGQRTGLSQWDAYKVNKMYGCPV